MNQELPPAIALFRLATGFYVSCAIHAAARLGIADLLKEGPQSHEALAAASGTHAPSLRRVLRLLASAGVLAEEQDGRFSLTAIGACLREDVPGSMRAAALLFGGPAHRNWLDLPYRLETGKPAFRRTGGADSFAHMAEHPIDQPELSRSAASNDVNMLVSTGGRQRSADEFRALYTAAGFALSRIVPTPARVSVIEGTPQ